MKSKKPLIIAIIVILLLILGAIVFAITYHMKKTAEYEHAINPERHADASLSMHNWEVSLVDAEIRAQKEK